MPLLLLNRPPQVSTASLSPIAHCTRFVHPLFPSQCSSLRSTARRPAARNFIQRPSCSASAESTPLQPAEPTRPIQATRATSLPLAEVLQQEQQRTQPWSWLGLLAKSVAVLAVGFVLAFSTVGAAEAARSGGRMGGRAFSAGRSSSSFGGSRGSGLGGSSFGGSSYGAAPSLGSHRSTSLTFAPSFFPLGFGYGYGGGGGGGFLTIILWAFVAALVLNVVQGMLNGGGDGDDSGLSIGGGRVAVGKLQVGLLGSARQLQRDLDRIAARADTSSPEGLQYVLQETVLSLLRNPEYCVYGAASVSSERGLEAGEDAFNELSMRERSKFEAETLVNVAGRSGGSSLKRKPSSSGNNELIVVTILVAVEGGLKLPKVTSREELTTALNRLGAVRADSLMATEVLWTPQDDDDYFTRDEIFQDYPELNTL